MRQFAQNSPHVCDIIYAALPTLIWFPDTSKQVVDVIVRFARHGSKGALIIGHDI